MKGRTQFLFCEPFGYFSFFAVPMQQEPGEKPHTSCKENSSSHKLEPQCGKWADQLIKQRITHQFDAENCQ